MISGRRLSRDEISEIWTIDRSEVVESVYRLQNGALVLRPEHFDVRGWPPGEAEKYTPILEACHDQHEGHWHDKQHGKAALVPDHNQEILINQF